MRLKGLLFALSFGIASASSAKDGLQNFQLVNGTPFVIDQVYVSPASVGEWQEDVLGRDLLAPKEAAYIGFRREERHCTWDLKAVYDDGVEATWESIDLCTVKTITIYYDRLRDETWFEYD